MKRLESVRSSKQDRGGGDRILEDLRERLLDKRRAQEGGERRVKLERSSRRTVQQEEIITVVTQAPPAPIPRHETAREKAERLEKEMRRERLLEAGESYDSF